MREKLVRDINTQFGPVFGSKKRKEQRQEIIANALDRYDEEIANGATEINAYRTTIGSLGNINKLRKPLGSRIRLRFDRDFWITVIILAISALLLTASAIVSAHTKVWMLFVGMLIVVALVGTATWRLATGNRRSIAPHIVVIVIGLHLFLYVGFFTLIGGMQLIQNAKAKTFDYTSRYAQVRSVELVKLNEAIIHEDGSDDVFDYTVIKELDNSQWEALLKDCAKLRYRFAAFGDPTFLTEPKNHVLIVIRFEQSDDPRFCVFYGSWDPGYLQGTEDSFKIDYECTTCDYDEWENILKTYFHYTP